MQPDAERDPYASDPVAKGYAASMHDSRYEVLLSAAEGEPAKDTAERTGCHESWIFRLRHEVCDELGARNMTHAVALAYQKGILRSDRPRRHDPPRP